MRKTPTTVYLLVANRDLKWPTLLHCVRYILLGRAPQTCGTMTLLQRDSLKTETYLPPGSLCPTCYRQLRLSLLFPGVLNLRQRTFTGLFRSNIRCMTLFPFDVLTFRSMTSSC